MGSNKWLTGPTYPLPQSKATKHDSDANPYVKPKYRKGWEIKL
jgi:hypothetical protein